MVESANVGPTANIGKAALYVTAVYFAISTVACVMWIWNSMGDQISRYLGMLMIGYIVLNGALAMSFGLYLTKIQKGASAKPGYIYAAVVLAAQLVSLYWMNTVAHSEYCNSSLYTTMVDGMMGQVGDDKQWYRACYGSYLFFAVCTVVGWITWPYCGAWVSMAALLDGPDEHLDEVHTGLINLNGDVAFSDQINDGMARTTSWALTRTPFGLARLIADGVISEEMQGIAGLGMGIHWAIFAMIGAIGGLGVTRMNLAYSGKGGHADLCKPSPESVRERQRERAGFK